MADNLYFSDSVKIDGGEEATLSATNVVRDSIDIAGSQAQNAGLAFADSVKIDGEENVSLSVGMVIIENIIAADAFDFLRNILRLARRIFTLRLRR
jgi:hypothetical protein